MPLIRVSDEVYQHLKDSGKDGESMDATIRRISNLSVAKAFRKYTEREKLIPLEAYRWMILSAYIPSGDNAKLTRAELQKYVEHLLDHHSLDEVFPADFALTPSSSSPRTRWKARFANIVGRLEESEVLNTVEDDNGKKSLTLDPVCRKEMLYTGLHIDREAGKCHFTQLPEYVTGTNWGDNLPLTVDDDELHEPVLSTEERSERMNRLRFLYNSRDFRSVTDSVKDFEEAISKTPIDLSGPKSWWVSYKQWQESGTITPNLESLKSAVANTIEASKSLYSDRRGDKV